MRILYIVELHLERRIVTDEVEHGSELRIVVGVETAVENADVYYHIILICHHHVQSVAKLIPHTHHRCTGAPTDNHALSIVLDVLFVHTDVNIIDILVVLLRGTLNGGLYDFAQLVAHIVLGIGGAIDEVPLSNCAAELFEGCGQRQLHTTVGRSKVVGCGVESQLRFRDSCNSDGLIETDARGSVDVRNVLVCTIFGILEMTAHDRDIHRLSIYYSTLARNAAQSGTHLNDIVDVGAGTLLKRIETKQVAILATAKHNLVVRSRNKHELIVGGKTFGIGTGGLRPIVHEWIVSVEGEHNALTGNHMIL